MESINRTAVIHMGGIGDFLLTCPALSELAKTTRLTLVGRVERLQLGVLVGIAEKAVDFDDVDFGSAFESPSPRLKQFLKAYERVIVWMRGEEVLIPNLKKVGVQQVDVFAGLPPDNWETHASLYYAQCLGFSKVDVNKWQISTSPQQTVVVIHPGSGSPRKNWPMQNFYEISQWIQKHGIEVQWCLGPAETNIELPSHENLVRIDTLVDLAKYLTSCKLYIGNDSGITHLAAAVQCPTIAIFGPTNPRVWGPLGPDVRIVYSPPWPTVDEVIEVIRVMIKR